MTSEALQSLLEAVAQGKTSPGLALDHLKNFSFQAIDDFAKVDHHRHLRTGFPEVIWGPGKTPEQIIQIVKALGANHSTVIATRIDAPVAEILTLAIPQLSYYPLARICALIQGELEINHPGVIGILTAGTADLAVAEEAAITATLSGFQVQRLGDVGVAGLHRLLSYRELIEKMDVVIVAAGMEGALPSVVAGLVDCPVIGVPTSVGYGTSFGGVAPLLTMLNSCAVGVGVVNIDNGFGAAILAAQILRTAQRLSPLGAPRSGSLRDR